MRPQRAFASIASITRRAAPFGLLLLTLLMAGGALALLAIQSTEAQSAPSPPASVSVTHGDGVLTATWPAGAGATTYWVAYKPVNAGWQNAAINHPTTSITIPNVDNTLSYIVQVASRNAHSDSGWTQSPPSGPYAPWFRPPPPDSVSATRGDGTITATWPAVASATGYRVVYWPLGNSLTTFATNYSGTSVTITGVDNSNYYFVAVHSVNQYGESDSRVSPIIWPITLPTATPATPPDMPASVRVTRGDGTMTVTWTASKRATGYSVLYQADDSSSWSTAASNIAATSYTIKGVDNAKGYSVAVHASNSGGHSSWNVVLQIMPYQPSNAPTTAPGTVPTTVPAAGTTSAPPAPMSVAVNRADGTLTASWPAVSGAHSYRVEHFTDDEHSDHTRVTWGHTANSIVITGVANATSYIVRVSARNVGGDSGWSYSPSAGPYNPPPKPTPRPTPVASPQPPPATPSSVTVTRADTHTHTTLAAAWPAVSGATSYQVIYRADGSAGWSNAALNHTGTGITITDTVSTNSYVVAVRARNSGSDSGWRESPVTGPHAPTFTSTPGAMPGPTPTPTPTPAPQSAPDAPASVTAFRTSSSTLTASWPAPAGATSYHVTYRSTDVHYWYLAALNHPTNSISIKGLDGGKSYVVGVRARNSLGDSGWRNSAPSGLYDPARPTPTPTPTPAPTQPPYQSAPARPASITLTRTDGALTATWPAVSGADVYNVAYSSDDGDTWLHASYYHPATSITISGADNSKPYIVGVRGRNSSGYGPWLFSNPIPAFNPGPTPTPAPQSAPRPPSSVTAIRSGMQITVAWPAVSGASEYQIQYGSKTGLVTATRNNLSTTFTITDSKIDGINVVRVRAGNSHGYSAWRNAPAILDYSPPATPASVSVTRSNGALTATWPAAPRADRYDVYYRSGDSLIAAALNHPYLSITINGVDNAKSYTVRVRARNFFGESAFRESPLVGPYTTASQSPPATPSSLSGVRSDGALTVTWPAVSGATGYEVRYQPSNGDWHTATANHTATSITISGLVNAKGYYVGVRARNQYGVSGWKLEGFLPWTPTTSAPGMPTSVTVTRGSGTLQVSWPAVSGATKYDVRAYSNGVLGPSANDHRATSITLTGVDNARTYNVAVQAGNSLGRSAWRWSADIGPYVAPTPTPRPTALPTATPPPGATATPRPTPRPRPAAPEWVKLTRANRTVTATWPAVSGATSYRIIYNSGSDWITASMYHPRTSITIIGADNAKSYTFRVRSLNAHSRSDWTWSPTIGPYSQQPTPTPTPTPTPWPNTLSVSNLANSKQSSCIVGRYYGGALHDCATGFRTGSNGNGYTLRAITAEFRRISAGTVGGFRVALHAASGGRPAANAAAVLSGNAPPITGGAHTYTCSGSGCNLSPNTDYFILITSTDTAERNFRSWQQTYSPNETAVPSNNGWTIHDRAWQRHNNGNWNQDFDTGVMKVEATPD